MLTTCRLTLFSAGPCDHGNPRRRRPGGGGAGGGWGAAAYEPVFRTADPGNAGWRRDLSVSFSKVGDVQGARGNLAPALDSYRASLAIAERLARADPGNAGWQRDLWVSLWRLARIDRGAVSWAQVLETMEAMKARGVLLPTDEPFLEQARALTAGTWANCGLRFCSTQADLLRDSPCKTRRAI
jgi:hypothetical protein